MVKSPTSLEYLDDMTVCLCFEDSNKIKPKHICHFAYFRECCKYIFEFSYQAMKYNVVG